MRIQLESPKSSSHTHFTPALVEDVLMEDDVIAASPGDEEEMMEDDQEAESDVAPDQCLAVLGITTSEDLVKRLKSKDDIDADGKTKVFVARAAFNDNFVPVAKKMFLLTDWILDTIVKNARDLPSYKQIDHYMNSEVMAELLVDDNYWKLLADCIVGLESADVVLLANRYPLPALLQSYVYFWRTHNYNSQIFLEPEEDLAKNGDAMVTFFRSVKYARTSKQVYSLDVLHACLASWLTIPEGMDTSFFASKTTASFLGCLEITLGLWLAESSKVNNHRKARDFFLTELLPLHAKHLWLRTTILVLHKGRKKAPEWSTLLDKFQAIIYRVSFQSLIVPELEDTRRAVLDAVRNQKSKSSLILLSTYLSQLCLHQKDKHSAKMSWIKEGEWKRELLQSFISPAVDLLISSSVEMASEDQDYVSGIMPSLHPLLIAANDWNMHYSDEDQSWRKLLEKVVDFILVQFAEAEVQSKSSDYLLNCIRTVCLEALGTVHELDETVLGGKRRVKAIQCALGYPGCQKDGLISTLCSTSIKSREVVTFVQSCQEALEEEVKQQVKAMPYDAHSDTLVSEKLIKTALFQEYYWHHSLGVAVRDFVSVDDVTLLLSSILKSLTKCYSDVYALSAGKKRKERDGTPEDQSNCNHPFSLAILQTYFACALLTHLAIPRPAYAAARDCISSIQTSVVQKYLEWALPRKNDRNCDALATAVLKMHDSVQQLALTCENEEQKGGSWRMLATQWDYELGNHCTAIVSLTCGFPSRRLELRVQALLSVLQLIRRAVERGLSTPFDILLSGTSGVTLFELGVFKDLCNTLRTSGNRLPISPFFIPHLHSLIDYGIEKTAAWSLLVSPYLPLFERLASDEMLRSIASLLVSLIKPSEPFYKDDKQSWKLLLSNSSNLELPRWRDLLCAEMRKEISKPVVENGAESSQVESAEMLDFFPSDWLPADLRSMLSEHDSSTNFESRTREEASQTSDSLATTALAFCAIKNGKHSHLGQVSEYSLASSSRRAIQTDYEATLDQYRKILGSHIENGKLLGTKTDEGENLQVEYTPRSLLQTLSILLCNSPEGTLFISQRYLSGVITCSLTHVTKEDRESRAAQNEEISGSKIISHNTSLAAIQFVETVLSTKPILFRSTDISTVFALAAEILVSKCESNSPFSSEKRNFFTRISTTLIECIRLRRDFVSQYLPQLTMLLVKMLQVFQGKTKSKEESKAGEKMGLEEAKIFSRLLSTVTAKSTSTSIGGLPESRLKSLSKSFSTHASYVIVAFVRNMTAITFARGEMREELIRGIYELCDIIGPWQKNVMMDMLADEGERIVMRTLWRGWEAQRYKGA